MVAIAPPPKYQRRPDRPRPPRASPAPSLPRSRSKSATPGGPPRCSHCNNATLVPDEGGLVCQTCGIINEEDANFRAEIEFDESSSGAIKTRGTHIGQHQSHSKTAYNSRVASAAHVGHEATKALDRAKSEAQQRVKYFALNLQVREPEENRAMFLFEQAYNLQFYRGRTLESVAIVCLYLAIRQCTSRDRYPLMLIDFAEISQGSYNVFELGKMAKLLQQKLYLDTTREHWFTLERQKTGASEDKRAELSARQAEISKKPGSMNLQDPEDLIERFCDKLDFGDMTNIVKRDAAKVAKSMNRDWMVTGRRPSGIAGAAVIIAARMNNFRRTLREVVLVAKVTEITLSKRLEEFKETKSSTMSVKDFRATDPTAVEGYDVQKPPSYYRALPEWQEKQANKKRKRKRKIKNGRLPETAAAIENEEDEESETENEDEDEEAENGNNEEEQPQAKRPRLDADGFVVPELPARSNIASSTETPQRRRLGKPKGAKNWKPRPPTEAEQEEERELEEDIADQLQRNASLDPTGTVVEDGSVSEPPAPGSGVLDIYPAPRRDTSMGPSVDSTVGNLGNTSMEENLGVDEFADDPDVANCVLSEQEKRIKETIWVTENADWLRTEHAKKIKRELKDRELREKGIDPEKERMKKIRRKDGMQRAGRAGDISYLEEARNKRREQDGTDADGVDKAQGANDEEEERQQGREVSIGARGSVQVMMQQRGTFSRRVDYNKLSQAYVLPGFEDSGESRSESPANPNRFFKPHQSRNHENSSRRRARATLNRIAGTMSSYETDGETDVERNSPQARSRSGSAVRAAAENEADEDEDAEYEQDTGTPEASVTVAPASSARQLPTPAATHTQPRAPSIPPHQAPRDPQACSTLTQEDKEDASESPLSSTHTPAGYGSGAHGTPNSTQNQAPQPQEAGTREDPEEVESEGDDDDYVDEDDEPDDDPDKYFGAGEEVVALGEEEEVVDDEF